MADWWSENTELKRRKVEVLFSRYLGVRWCVNRGWPAPAAVRGAHSHERFKAVLQSFLESGRPGLARRDPNSLCAAFGGCPHCLKRVQEAYFELVHVCESDLDCGPIRLLAAINGYDEFLERIRTEIKDSNALVDLHCQTSSQWLRKLFSLLPKPILAYLESSKKPWMEERGFEALLLLGFSIHDLLLALDAKMNVCVGKPKRLSAAERAIVEQHVNADLVAPHLNGDLMQCEQSQLLEWLSNAHSPVSGTLPSTASRLLTTLEAFTSMVRAWPHRPRGLPVDRALAELDRNPNGHFDPDAVKLVKQLVRELPAEYFTST